MTVYVAPKGTRMWAKGGVEVGGEWKHIGNVDSITYEQETEEVHSWASPSARAMVTNRSVRLDFEDGRTLYAPSVKIKQLSPNDLEITLDSYSFPQRYYMGLPSKEDKLARTSIAGKYSRNLIIDGYRQGIAKVSQLSNNGSQTSESIIEGLDVAKTAKDFLERTEGSYTPTISKMDGKDTISAGNARVYAAQSEGEAARNLNFAMANLASYIRYHDIVKPAQKKAEAAAAEKARIEKEQEAYNKAGLDLYNKVNGTRYVTWGPTSLSLSSRSKWADKAVEISKLKSETNPFIGISAAINAATMNTAINSRSLFGF